MKPELLRYLQSHGQEIGEQAKAGDVLCRQIRWFYNKYLQRQSTPAMMAVFQQKVETYQTRTDSSEKIHAPAPK